MKEIHLAVGFLFLFLASGCRYTEQVLGEPEHRIDPREAFPGFAAEAEAWDFPPCDDGRVSGGRHILLAETVAGAMPSSRGWKAEKTPGSTLLVHYPQGGAHPSAFLFVERIDSSASGGLGAAFRAFQQRVDRRFALSAGEQGTALREIGRGSEDSGETATEAGPVRKEGGTLPSGGQGPSEEESDATVSEGVAGPGYSSDPGTFTGWRWIGRCLEPDSLPVDPQNRPFLRLGRTAGSWQFDGIAGESPAFMILGTATLRARPQHGIHLAAVCSYSGGCGAGSELAALLGSLRFSDAGDSERSWVTWGDTEGRDLAREVGLRAPVSQAP